MARRDSRSPEARMYRSLYATSAWKHIREAQLKRAPLCRMCQGMGRIVAASVVDHITPHKGDTRLFSDPDNLQSLCFDHHNSAKQREERKGYADTVDADGYPTDPRHPARR